MADKKDIGTFFGSVSGLMTSIGTQLKENERQRKIGKVLNEFNDPTKVFYNADGTKKTPSEIAPKITEGVTNLMQLGEDKLASSLASYFGTMTEAFGKEATNEFLFKQASKDNKFFPTDESGKQLPYSAYVDYNKAREEKQYAPQATGTWRLLPTTLKDGTFDYYYYNNKSGLFRYLDTNGKMVETPTPTSFKTGKVDPTNYSVSQSSVFHSEKERKSTAKIQLSDGTVIDGFVGEYGVITDTNGKRINEKVTEIRETGKLSEKDSLEIQKKEYKEEMNRFSDMIDNVINNPTGDVTITYMDKLQLMDYIQGGRNDFPSKFLDLNLGESIKAYRDFYINNLKR